MNKLVGLILMSAVVNNIYSSCGNCCCCNKKSNNNSGTGGNDKPEEKPIEITTDVNEPDTLIINGDKIKKVEINKLNANYIDVMDAPEYKKQAITCSNLTEDRYKEINSRGLYFKGFHKDEDRFITFTQKVGDIYAFIDFKITQKDDTVPISKNVTELNILGSMKLDSTEKLFSLPNLETINGLSNLNTSDVTIMKDMFKECKLEILDISCLDTSKVTNMCEMFKSCKAREIRGLENFKTSNVASMYYMFSDMSSIVDLNLSSFDTIKIEHMAGMFSGCKNLQKLTLGDKFIVKGTYNNMFVGCISLVVVIKNEEDGNLLDSLNKISTNPELQFTYKQKVKDGAPADGYYRNDYIRDGYK